MWAYVHSLCIYIHTGTYTYTHVHVHIHTCAQYSRFLVSALPNVGMRSQPLYVSKDRLMSLDGELVGRTNRILNIANPTTHAWGTFNPESVIMDDSFFYGFDLYNGLVWRTGADGQTNLSYIKNNKMFKDISEKNLKFVLNFRDNISVMSAAEPRYNMIYFSFSIVQDNGLGGVTVVDTPIYGFRNYNDRLGFTASCLFTTN